MVAGFLPCEPNRVQKGTEEAQETTLVDAAGKKCKSLQRYSYADKICRNKEEKGDCKSFIVRFPNFKSMPGTGFAPLCVA